MKIVEHEGFYKLSRITGPKHNYLGIAFSNVRSGIELIARSVAGDIGKTECLSAQEVMEVVTEAVEREMDVTRRLYISRIEYIPTDTPELQAYEEMATLIARFALQKLGCVKC